MVKPGRCQLVVGGRLAVLLLQGCSAGAGEARRSFDLSLITAYLVVSNSNSVETRGRDEDDVMPDGSPVPSEAPCGSKAAQQGSAA